MSEALDKTIRTLAGLQQAVQHWEGLVGCRIEGVEAVGLDLRGVDMRTSSWIRCNLDKAQLSRCDLSGASFEEVRLVGADLRDVLAGELQLRHCEAKGVSLDGARLRQARIEDSNFDEASFVGCKLREAVLCRLRFGSADLGRVQAQHSRWEDIDSPDASWEKAELAAAEMKNWRAEGARLGAIDIETAKLVDCRLTNASLHGAQLPEKLEGLDLTGADLEACTIHGLDTTRNGTPRSLRRAVIRDSRFSGDLCRLVFDASRAENLSLIHI